MKKVGLAIRLIFGPDSDSCENPSKNKTDSSRIPDSKNILKGF